MYSGCCWAESRWFELEITVLNILLDVSAHETDPLTEGSVSVKAESGLCLHRERSSAFWRGPVVREATEMKMSDCQCIDSYNEKDSCGQSGVFMSVDLQLPPCKQVTKEVNQGQEVVAEPTPEPG